MNLGIIIQNFIEQYGIISIFVIILLEYSNMPIPSEVVLPVVGIIASGGSISMSEAIFISLVAGLVGSLLNYYLGYYLGNPLLKKIVKINPKLQRSVNSSMWWINKYGELSVMISRVIPLARTFISIPAGVLKMKLSKFLIYSSLGIVLWNTSLIYLGYVCGNNIELIANILNKYSIVTIFILIIGATTAFLITIFSKNKNK